MPPGEYPRVEVSAWELAGIEVSGQSGDWLREPVVGELWYYKPVVIKNGFQQGEDWAEKVSGEIAVLLNVPAAHIELAARDRRAGCLSRNLVPHDWELLEGAVLLPDIVGAGYQVQTPGREGHSLQNIRQLLQNYAVPPDAALPTEFSSFDVFAGYLVLDALIANRDRHEENWAVLRAPAGAGEPDRLCPSYDHATSLGFNLRDEERARRLSEASVEAWARRGTAWRFQHGPTLPIPTLVETAGHALAVCGPGTRTFWLDAVSSVTADDFHRLLSSVVDLSEVAITFAVELLSINKRRVLDGC